MAKPYKEKLESKHATDLEASVIRLHTFLIGYLSVSVDTKILVKTVARYRKMIEKADKALKTAAYRKKKLALHKRRTVALEKLLDAKMAEHGSPSFSDLAGLVQDDWDVLYAYHHMCARSIARSVITDFSL